MAKSEKEIVETNGKELEKAATIQTIEAAIHSIRGQMNEENRDAALSVISFYNKTIKQLKQEENETDSLGLKKDEIGPSNEGNRGRGTISV